jgi:hypothetical protein
MPTSYHVTHIKPLSHPFFSSLSHFIISICPIVTSNITAWAPSFFLTLAANRQCTSSNADRLARYKSGLNNPTSAKYNGRVRHIIVVVRKGTIDGTGQPDISIQVILEQEAYSQHCPYVLTVSYSAAKLSMRVPVSPDRTSQHNSPASGLSHLSSQPHWFQIVQDHPCMR